MKTLTRSLSLLVLVCGAACSVKFNRPRQETQLGSHHVSIRPYCQSSATRSLTHHEKDGTSSTLYWQFTCDNTTILIRDNTLTVNDKPYGPLNEGDQIAVDYGKVRVNREVRTEVR